MNIHVSTPQNKMRGKMFRQMNLSWSDMSFSDRLKDRMALLNIKAIEIATRLNLSRGTVSQWVNGIAEPKGSNASRLAALLRCNVNWLMNGKGTAEKMPEPELEPGPDIRGMVPVISWIQAGSWLEVEYQAQDHTEWVSHTASVGPRAFSLRVRGDSMTSMTGRSIPEGSIVIVDPDEAYDHGKVVVARLDDSGAVTLKELIIDGSQKFLRPFNNAYPMMPINGNCTIIGVVKQVVQNF